MVGRGRSQPIPAAEPVELAFGLQPAAHRFATGNRIRLTVTFADADNYETPVLDPPPRARVHRGGQYASSVELPLGP